jgi:hypothetical protein
MNTYLFYYSQIKISKLAIWDNFVCQRLIVHCQIQMKQLSIFIFTLHKNNYYTFKFKNF